MNPSEALAALSRLIATFQERFEALAEPGSKITQGDIIDILKSVQFEVEVLIESPRATLRCNYTVQYRLPASHSP
jgi:hypothetical protein